MAEGKLANLNNLTQEEQTIDRVVRAHDESVAKLKLTELRDKGKGEYFLIFEKTPQFHEWYDVHLLLQGPTTTYAITKVAHVG
jgi:hypothetical protein